MAFAWNETEITSLTAFPDLPLPEKVMASWCEVGGRTVTLVTYHAPTGVQHQLKKPEQAVQIARWLTRIDGPVIMAGDFNTPKLDPPDWSRIRTHWHTGDRKLDGVSGTICWLGLRRSTVFVMRCGSTSTRSRGSSAACDVSTRTALW